MFFFQGTPEPASNEKIVTRLAAPARYRAPLFNKSNYAHGDGDWPGRAARLAAVYADVKPLRRPAQPAIELFDPPDVGWVGGHKRNQRELRHLRGGGDIADRADQCFAANGPRPLAPR